METIPRYPQTDIMAHYFNEDFCALKNDLAATGHVTHTGHDVYPEEIDVEEAFFVHRNLPTGLRTEIERTKLVPKGHVILLITMPFYANLLVAEDDLVLVDRYFSRGDVVKRNPLDAQSGSVIGSYSNCTLRPSFAAVRMVGGGSPSIPDFIELDAPHITSISTHDIVKPQGWMEGGSIVCYDWLGTIKYVHEAVVVKLTEGGVVTIPDADDVEETVSLPMASNTVYKRFGGSQQNEKEVQIQAKPCYDGQRVRISRQVLSKSKWLLGSYKRRVKPDGVVIHVMCTMIEVDWKTSKFDTSTQPARELFANVLASGAVKLYNPSRCPKLASGIDAQDLAIYPPFATAGEHVGFKGDADVVQTKYDCQVKSIVGQITSIAGRIKVRWQDNSITDEPSSSICPYDEVDDHDVWPGELVSRKDQEDSHQDPSYEKMIKTRAVGVVQSVNAVERIALVRWFESTDLTITGENHDELVRSHSTLGRITENITEVSVFEVEAYQAIARRRGDMVCIRPPNAPNSPRFFDSIQGIFNNNPLQEEDEWYGEVVDLLLDGQVLVRLGGLEHVRDVTYSVLDLTVVVSADDDTTESSTDSMDMDLSDEDGVSVSHRPEKHAIASTTIEYEGAAPLDAGSEGEDQWTTDSDSMQYENELPSLQDSQAGLIDISKHGEKEDISSPARSGEKRTDSAPDPFDLLEGHSPEHTFGANSNAHSGKWLKAILREHQILRSSLPEGVYVRTWESSLELIRVLIVGPSGTPYALAPFLFDIHLSNQFPYEAPSAYFHSWTNGIGRVNPNLYEDGKVCLSLLGTWFSEKDDEEWVPFQSSILQIIVSLLGLVLVKEPFYSKSFPDV